MSYYNVDAVLTDAQKIPCTFEIDVPGLGYLDGNPGSTIKAGTKIDLPLWLGIMLAVSSGNSPSAQSLVSIDFPPALQQRVVNALKADPKSVDIRAQASHFYTLAARVLELFEDDALIEVLTETFRLRAAEIADHAHNPSGGVQNGQNFLQSLDETERQLYRAAHDGTNAVRDWALSLRTHA